MCVFFEGCNSNIFRTEKFASKDILVKFWDNLLQNQRFPFSEVECILIELQEKFIKSLELQEQFIKFLEL